MDPTNKLQSSYLMKVKDGVYNSTFITHHVDDNQWNFVSDFYEIVVNNIENPIIAVFFYNISVKYMLFI